MGLFDLDQGIDWASLLNPMNMPEPSVLDKKTLPGVDATQAGISTALGQGATDYGEYGSRKFGPSGMSPEVLAANAAARGISPPPVDLQPNAASSDVGAALTGNVPLPRPRPEGTDVGAQSKTGAPMDITSDAQKAGAGADGKKPSFLDALKGVKAPPNPEVQKISTPAAPRPTTAIKGGDLMALLTALNAAPGAGGIKLPSTLGQALGK
jgi:hypothetical protein